MAVDKKKMPLLAAMYKYIADGAVGYHTPGHKQGKGIPDSMRELITPVGLKMEISLMEELDDLHAPSAYIKDSQELAAKLYGADESFYVINGTTGAIHAMLLAAVRDGEKIILPRNAHRSVVGGLILSGAEPVYMRPEIDAELGIAMAVTPEAVQQAVQENPTAKAVLLVYPTYYGVTADLTKIAEIVHAANMLLLIDEAHGPHLNFSAELPAQALDCGADIVAQSTHKIVGAMTQCSMLHIKGSRVDRERVRSSLSLLQSTSPNYLMLASLEAACCQMAEQGCELVGRAVKLARYLRQEINKLDGLYCFGRERLAAIKADGLDETKLTVSVKGLGLSGTEAEHILRHKHKIQAELSDEFNVLFIISYADSQKEADYLLAALRSLAAEKRPAAKINATENLAGYGRMPVVCLSPREAVKQPRKQMEFTASDGKLSGETITFYPPGIPLVCPGERIDKELIDYCLAMQGLGLKIVGPEDTSLQYINVLEK